MTKRTSKSPYQRHQKAPYLYSSYYQRWREAVRQNNPKAISEAHAAFMAFHNIKPPTPQRNSAR